MREGWDSSSLSKVIKRLLNNPPMGTGKQKQTAANTYSKIQMHLHKDYDQANCISFSLDFHRSQQNLATVPNEVSNVFNSSTSSALLLNWLKR